MRGQLITKGGSTSVTLNVLRENAAGIVPGFVEELRSQKKMVNDVPGCGMPYIIQNDEIGIDPEFRFVSRGYRLRNCGINPVREQDICIGVAGVAGIVDAAASVKVNRLISNGSAQF